MIDSTRLKNQSDVTRSLQIIKLVVTKHHYRWMRLSKTID